MRIRVRARSGRPGGPGPKRPFGKAPGGPARGISGKGRFGPAGDRTTADVVVDREPPATLGIGTRSPAPDMTRRKGSANSAAHPAANPAARAGGGRGRSWRRRHPAVPVHRAAHRARPPSRNRSDVRGDRPAGTVMRDGDVRCARTRQDGNASGDGRQAAIASIRERRHAAARETDRQAGSASRSLAIPAVAIFAGWRFRLKGRRKPDLAPRRAVATGRAMARPADYAPVAMPRYCFRMRLAEANRRLTRSCIQLPV